MIFWLPLYLSHSVQYFLICIALLITHLKTNIGLFINNTSNCLSYSIDFLHPFISFIPLFKSFTSIAVFNICFTGFLFLLSIKYLYYVLPTCFQTLNYEGPTKLFFWLSLYLSHSEQYFLIYIASFISPLKRILASLLITLQTFFPIQLISCISS